MAPLIHLSGTTSPHPRRLAAGVILLCLAVGVQLGAWPRDVLAQEPAAGNVKATVENVLSNPAYQTEFPGDPRAMPQSDADASPSTSSPQTQNSQPDSVDDSPPPPPEPPATANGSLPDLRYLLLAVAIGGFLLLGIYLLMKRPALPATATPAPPRTATAVTVAPAVSASAPIPGPIDEAERLAQAGRYGEAIHLILLRFLGELRHSAQVTMTDASTSREILRSGAVPTTMRSGLATVIGAVELCHFGGRDADEKLFRHCAEAYYATQSRHATSTLSATRP